MNLNQKHQIELMLEHYGSQFARQSRDEHEALYARSAANHYLQSGNSVIESLKILENVGDALLSTLVDKVTEVAHDSAAFDMIIGELEIQFTLMAIELDRAVGMATGRREPKMQSVAQEADKRFDDLKIRLKRQVDIARLNFMNMPRTVKEGPLQQVGREATAAPALNMGGKPLAKHWDRMWAAIAVQLWNGDLNPQSQAEIKTAMFAWFNESGIAIGDTAVTDRARALWLLMEAEK